MARRRRGTIKQRITERVEWLNRDWRVHGNAVYLPLKGGFAAVVYRIGRAWRGAILDDGRGRPMFEAMGQSLWPEEKMLELFNLAKRAMLI